MQELSNRIQCISQFVFLLFFVYNLSSKTILKKNERKERKKKKEKEGGGKAFFFVGEWKMFLFLMKPFARRRKRLKHHLSRNWMCYFQGKNYFLFDYLALKEIWLNLRDGPWGNIEQYVKQTEYTLPGFKKKLYGYWDKMRIRVKYPLSASERLVHFDENWLPPRRKSPSRCR